MFGGNLKTLLQKMRNSELLKLGKYNTDLEGLQEREKYLLLEDGVEASNLVPLGVNKGALRLTRDHISSRLGQWQQLVNFFQTIRLAFRQLFPQLLHQVHVGTFVFLHAALGDAGHVCS